MTEALLFADSLYASLGLSNGTKFKVQVTHRNFAGRELNAIGSRTIFPARTSANESTSEVELAVGESSGELVAAVKTLLAPLFILFDFNEFGDSVYEDIVRRFENGKTD